MKGAIFYTSKYGSTQQYAKWIAEATGLPIFDVREDTADLQQFDFLIIGSPIMYFRLSIRDWIKKNMSVLETKPVIFYSVSGAGAGKKLDGWVEKSLPEKLTSKMHHVALRGRQIKEYLSAYDKIMLVIGAMFNRDKVAREHELKGFDFMDKSSIGPILQIVEKFQMSTADM